MAIAALLGACTHRTPAPPAVAAAPVVATAPQPASASASAAAHATALRAWARELARAQCTPCHIRSLPEAKPAALAIFDLDAQGWSSTISAQRLRAGFTRRLQGRLDDAGRQRLQAFVESEIGAREKP